MERAHLAEFRLPLAAGGYYGLRVNHLRNPSFERNVDWQFMTKKPLTSEELKELTAGLNKLARNLWWTWDQEAQEIFQELSPRGWQNLYHNAVAILHEVSDYELRVRLQDPDFAERVRRGAAAFEAYMNEQHTWAHEHAPALAGQPGGLFLGGVRLSRDAADRGGRPGHPGGRPRQVGQRPGHRLCRASACSTAKAISSRRSTRTTGRRNTTRC